MSEERDQHDKNNVFVVFFFFAFLTNKLKTLSPPQWLWPYIGVC